MNEVSRLTVKCWTLYCVISMVDKSIDHVNNVVDLFYNLANKTENHHPLSRYQRA